MPERRKLVPAYMLATNLKPPEGKRARGISGAATGIDPASSLASSREHLINCVTLNYLTTNPETLVGTKKSGKGRRKVGRKKRRMRAKIRHRKK